MRPRRSVLARVTWTIKTRFPPGSPVHAALEAFCAVRRPDTVATVFHVDGEVVDLAREIAANPSLLELSEHVYFLLPAGNDGPAEGPFNKNELPLVHEGAILKVDLVTGKVSVKRAR